jgi:hypothetical protein
MHKPFQPTGHSADVRLELLVGEQTIQLAQLLRDTIIVAAPTALPPCAAEVRLTIDGHETRWPVYLPDGISADSTRAMIR